MMIRMPRLKLRNFLSDVAPGILLYMYVCNIFECKFDVAQQIVIIMLFIAFGFLINAISWFLLSCPMRIIERRMARKNWILTLFSTFEAETIKRYFSIGDVCCMDVDVRNACPAVRGGNACALSDYFTFRHYCEELIDTFHGNVFAHFDYITGIERMVRGFALITFFGGVGLLLTGALVGIVSISVSLLLLLCASAVSLYLGGCFLQHAMFINMSMGNDIQRACPLEVYKMLMRPRVPPNGKHEAQQPKVEINRRKRQPKSEALPSDG